ncbi:K(+)/H(+) antiporter [Physocladia obscura]|uniref:K(+)/H(+) antiporter n=1 Tax=Physocladia obscura TaxID=109957 RepID=A0AAD5T3G8_9FUNG|nr:K(+)/H(+) antiporter [Physocladia obscura]
MSTTTTPTSILNGDNPLLISALSLFLVQAVLVIGTSWILSFGLRYIRQPQVISEVLGGIILGGSALCKISSFKTNVFPDSSLPAFKLVANFGLVLYLFLIGLELDPVKIIKSVGRAVPIAATGIILPFSLGVGIAKYLYHDYSTPDIPFVSFFLFVGVAMSITAFPVLARILTEKKLLHTRVGQAAISAAAIDDITAWTLLVLVIAIVNNNKSGTSVNYVIPVYVFLTVIAYGLLMWFIVRPGITKLIQFSATSDKMSRVLLVTVFLGLLISAWFMEVVGVNGIFGAFLFGAIMPHDHGFAWKLASQMEDLVSIVFLPLYFASSGLSTRLDLLNDGKAWGTVILIITTACTGKFLGCTISSKIVLKHSWRESAAIGVLMNTKGLVELIVLNLGLSAGVISPTVFSMFVVEALVTTCMTSPIISVVYPERMYIDAVMKKTDDDNSGDSPQTEPAALAEPTDLVPESSGDVRALVCLTSMEIVPSMMTLTTLLASTETISSFIVYAFRLTRLDFRQSTRMQISEQKSTSQHDPVLTVFRSFTNLHNVPAHSMLTFSEAADYPDTIISAVRYAHANLLILPHTVLEASTDHSILQQFEFTRSDTESTVQKIIHTLPGTTVIQFIERGFGSSAAGTTYLHETTTATKQQIIKKPSNSALKVLRNPVAAVLVLGGDKKHSADDVAAVKFIWALIDSARNQRSQMDIEITLVVYKIANGIPDTLPPAASSSATVNVNSFGWEYDLATLGVEAITVDAVSEISNLVNLKTSFATDLVVVSESVLAGEEIGPNLTNDSSSRKTLRNWLEETCVASVAVVNGKRAVPTEFISST